MFRIMECEKTYSQRFPFSQFDPYGKLKYLENNLRIQVLLYFSISRVVLEIFVPQFSSFSNQDNIQKVS